MPVRPANLVPTEPVMGKLMWNSKMPECYECDCVGISENKHQQWSRTSLSGRGQHRHASLHRNVTALSVVCAHVEQHAPNLSTTSRRIYRRWYMYLCQLNGPLMLPLDTACGTLCGYWTVSSDVRLMPVNELRSLHSHPKFHHDRRSSSLFGGHKLPRPVTGWYVLNVSLISFTAVLFGQRTYSVTGNVNLQFGLAETVMRFRTAK